MKYLSCEMLKNLGFFVCMAGMYGFATVQSNYCPTPEPSPDITGNLTCDDTLQVFVDGQQTGPASHGYETADKYLIPANSRVLGLKCHGRIKLSVITGAGILGSLSNGLVTSPLWRCTNTAQQGWAEASFDDSSWPMAYEHASNMNDSTSFPWGLIHNVSAIASWIWTKDNKLNDLTVYCRIRLRNDTYKKCVIERKADLFISSAPFINRALQGSVVITTTTASSTQCALRCQRVPLCASFNFEYGGRDTQKLCELNSKTLSDPHELVERNGFEYFNKVVH